MEVPVVPLYFQSTLLCIDWCVSSPVLQKAVGSKTKNFTQQASFSLFSSSSLVCIRRKSVTKYNVAKIVMAIVIECDVKLVVRPREPSRRESKGLRRISSNLVLVFRRQKIHIKN